MAADAVLARVIRSGLEESTHRGNVAVCDPDGRLVAWAGDPRREVFARSCMKPLQGAVSLAWIGGGPTDREIAVICASHNGEPAHVRTVRRVLARGGLGPSALRCPADLPLDPGSAARIRAPTPLFNNCSGKHAGMLLASVRAGWKPETYLSPGHPYQRRVLAAVLAATGLPGVRVGVDGCGVPVHGMPLASVATLYARLGTPERLGRLAATAARCADAIRAHPYLVGGRHRFDTSLMEAAPGILAKEGAEALVCVSLPELGLGVAVKVTDGSWRAAAPIMIQVLQQLDALSRSQLRRLDAFARPPVLGGGRPVGRIEATFSLQRRPVAP